MQLENNFVYKQTIPLRAYGNRSLFLERAFVSSARSRQKSKNLLTIVPDLLQNFEVHPGRDEDDPRGISSDRIEFEQCPVQ